MSREQVEVQSVLNSSGAIEKYYISIPPKYGALVGAVMYNDMFLQVTHLGFRDYELEPATNICNLVNKAILLSECGKKSIKYVLARLNN